MSSSKLEVWIVHALVGGASHAREAHDKSTEAVSKREEANGGELLMGLLVSQSWWTAVWYFFVSMAAVILLFDTSVDFNTVQVTYTVQLHSFVFEDCRKSHFNSIQDASAPRFLC